MTTHKFLKRDVRLGITNRSYLYIIPILFSYIMVKESSSGMHIYQDMKYMWSEGSVWEYYIDAVTGMNFYRFDPQQQFTIPLYWFIFQIGISYFTAYYAEKDYSENAVLVFTAGKSRSSWWFSKVIWCILSVLVYYFVMIASCVICALLRGAKPSLSVSSNFLNLRFGYNMKFLSFSDLILITVIVPLVVTTAICLVQMLLSFIISPVTSFAIVCGIYILSAYYTSWFLPGNYTMWLRSSYFDERGLNPYSGLLIALFLIAGVVVLGRTYFEDKDVI